MLDAEASLPEVPSPPHATKNNEHVQSPESLDSKATDIDLLNQTEDVIGEVEDEQISLSEYLTDNWEDWDYQEIQKTEQDLDELATYHEFDPEHEVKKIHQLKGDEEGLSESERIQKRFERLTAFHTKQVKQQKAIADAAERLSATVTSNPDISLGEIMSIVNDFAPRAMLTEEHYELLSIAAGRYVKKHKIAEEYFTSLSPQGVFKAAFGKDANGRIEIEKGPMTILLRLFDEVDYAHGFYSHASNLSLDEPMIKHATSSAGAAVNTTDDPRLTGIIILENNTTNGLYPKEFRDDLRAHEEQHQFNKLFSPIEARIGKDRILSVLGDPRRTEEEALRSLLKNYSRFERVVIGIDGMARDEMIAYYAGGTSSGMTASLLITDDLYDYPTMYKKEIAGIRERLQGSIKDYRENMSKGKDQESFVHEGITPERITQEEIEPYIHWIFGRFMGSEYYKTLRSWAGAIGQLETNGYQQSQILQLLYTTPAHQWPKLARRLPKLDGEDRSGS